MNNQVKVNITKLKLVLSIVLAAITLAVVLTYMLGGQALLQSEYAEPGHNLIMSMMQVIGSHMLSVPQMHAGQTSESQTQSPMHGIIGNNVLGGQATLPAGGLAVVVAISAVALAALAFVVSLRQRSFVVAGLLVANGIILMVPPLIALAKINFAVIGFQGPVVGITFGMVILGLGLAKGVGTAKASK